MIILIMSGFCLMAPAVFAAMDLIEKKYSNDIEKNQKQSIIVVSLLGLIFGLSMALFVHEKSNKHWEKQIISYGYGEYRVNQETKEIYFESKSHEELLNYLISKD